MPTVISIEKRNLLHQDEMTEERQQENSPENANLK